MSKHNETLAEIVAEMRGMGNYQRYSGDHAHALADRIEASWKRVEQTYLDQIRDAMNQWGHEKYKAERAPIGNSAALREALSQTHQWLIRLFEGGNDDSDIDHIMSHLQHCRNVCASALSAPPRNCDVYKTPEESIRMFESYIRESGKVGFINPFTEVVKWLFAPATEKKGESDGSK